MVILKVMLVCAPVMSSLTCYKFSPTKCYIVISSVELRSDWPTTRETQA